MRYMNLTPTDRESLLNRIGEMPGFVGQIFAGLSRAAAATPGPEHLFSPAEQCWHLADLEREGFGARIRRLAEEDDPVLPDFDGDRIAKERNYRSLSLQDGVEAFRAARAANIERLRGIADAEWTRAGTQEGVGRVALCDLPAMMAEHDASHRREIEAWMRSFARGA